MIEKEDKFNKMIDFVGFGSVGVICFFYSLFWSDFAELHIALPFLDFPIFIGEILLFFCVVLLFLKWNTVHFKLSNKYWPFLLYAIWVLFRALHGYFQWGPLALRNAALFYYPFFAFIGYHFYRRDFFSQKTIYALFFILVIAKIVAGANFMYYFFTPYLMLAIFLILKMRMKKMRYFAFAILIYSFPFKAFFQGSRSFLVANLAVVLFLFLVYFGGWIKVKKAIKILGLTLAFSISIFIFLKFAPSEKARSLTAPHYIIEQFRAYDKMIQKNKKDFVPREIPVKIYNPNKNQIKWDNIDEQEKIGHEIRAKVNNIMKEIDAGVDRDELESVSANEPEGIKSVARNEASFVVEPVEHKSNEIETELDDGKGQKLGSVREVNNIVKEIDAGVDRDELESVSANELEGIKSGARNEASFVVELVEHKSNEIETDPDDGKGQKLESVREESRYFRVFQEQKEQVRREVFASNETDQRKMMYFDEEFGTAVNEAVENLVEKKEVIDGIGRGRGMQAEYGNILFRLLIWREMTEEIIKEKKWFGFSFGKPQRSISLENSGFAAGEWGRDGWIAPHNVFLNIIYRAGIPGVFMVCGIFVFLFRMIKEFFKKQCIEWMLLISILIYWLVLSTTLVVLELPYQSIPFWTLFGMVFAYLYKNTEKFSL